MGNRQGRSSSSSSSSAAATLSPPLDAPAQPQQQVVLLSSTGCLSFPYQLPTALKRLACETQLRRSPVTEGVGGRRFLEVPAGSSLARLYPCTQWRSRRLFICGRRWLAEQPPDWEARVEHERGGCVLGRPFGGALVLFCA